MQASARRLAALVAVSTAAILAVACSSSSTTSPAEVSLAGTYSLYYFSESGQDFTAFVSSGAATLTGTTYKVNIQFQGNALPAITDSGTYSAQANGSFSQTSQVDAVQSTGSYNVRGDTLTVNVTAQGVNVVQGWLKQ